MSSILDEGQFFASKSRNLHASMNLHHPPPIRHCIGLCHSEARSLLFCCFSCLFEVTGGWGFLAAHLVHFFTRTRFDASLLCVDVCV